MRLGLGNLEWKQRLGWLTLLFAAGLCVLGAAPRVAAGTAATDYLQLADNCCADCEAAAKAKTDAAAAAEGGLESECAKAHAAEPCVHAEDGKHENCPGPEACPKAKEGKCPRCAAAAAAAAAAAEKGEAE